jgi:hypothetical protein
MPANLTQFADFATLCHIWQTWIWGPPEGPQTLRAEYIYTQDARVYTYTHVTHLRTVPASTSRAESLAIPEPYSTSRTAGHVCDTPPLLTWSLPLTVVLGWTRGTEIKFWHVKVLFSGLET